MRKETIKNILDLNEVTSNFHASKINTQKAQGVTQYNNVANPKRPEEEETSQNRNHIITGKQQQTN